MNHFIFHRALPIHYQALCWIAGIIAAILIGLEHPSDIYRAVMASCGIILLTIWLRYFRLAIWTAAINPNSIALTLISVMGSVLLVCAIAVDTHT